MKAWIFILVLLIAVTLAHGQTSKTAIKNGVLQSDLDAAGYKILSANMADYAGIGMTWNPTTGRFDTASSGGTGTVTSIIATTPIIVTPSPLVATGVISLNTTSKTNWDTAYSERNQWDGGATGLVAATGRTSLALVIGTNVQAWDTDLDTWATKTPYAGTVTVTTGKTFNCTGTLTLSGTDGSTLNVGGGGTLGTAAYTASTAYQAADTDLTTWAGVTPTSGIQTWLATPSSANLRGAVTDENGTGALLFSGATTPDFTTGFTIGAAAASGKILIGNGTNYVPSTPTYPNAASPTALKYIRSDGTNWVASTSTQSDTPGTVGKLMQSDGTNWISSTPTWPVNAASTGSMVQANGSNWLSSTPAYPITAGTAGYTMRSDGTNFASYPAQLVNSSVASQSPSSSDVYLTGSNIVVTVGDMKAKGQYKCVFDMTKSAGTGAIVITLRVGTLGTTGDAAIQTYTFGAGTAVADTGIFEVIATWRTVGTGTSAVIQGICRGTHNLATTGLFNNAAGFIVIGSPSPSSGFNSSTATTIGLSFNGSTAFAGTTQVVQAQLQQ